MRPTAIPSDFARAHTKEFDKNVGLRLRAKPIYALEHVAYGVLKSGKPFDLTVHCLR